MNPKVRPFLGALAGLVVSFVVITVIEMLGHLIYPPPDAAQVASPGALAAYVAGLPPGSLFFVLAAWVLGTFLGGIAGALIAGGRPLLYAGLVGGMTLIGAVMNFFMIPHPGWFVGVSLVCIAGSAYLAAMMARNLLGQKETT